MAGNELFCTDLVPFVRKTARCLGFPILGVYRKFRCLSCDANECILIFLMHFICVCVFLRPRREQIAIMWPVLHIEHILFHRTRSTWIVAWWFFNVFWTYSECYLMLSFILTSFWITTSYEQFFQHHVTGCSHRFEICSCFGGGVLIPLGESAAWLCRNVGGAISQCFCHCLSQFCKGFIYFIYCFCMFFWQFGRKNLERDLLKRTFMNIQDVFQDMFKIIHGTRLLSQCFSHRSQVTWPRAARADALFGFRRTVGRDQLWSCNMLAA